MGQLSQALQDKVNQAVNHFKAAHDTTPDAKNQPVPVASGSPHHISVVAPVANPRVESAPGVAVAGLPKQVVSAPVMPIKPPLVSPEHRTATHATSVSASDGTVAAPVAPIVPASQQSVV